MGTCSFLLHGMEVSGQKLVHGEHMHSVLFEDGVHFVIASNLSFVVGVLQVALFDVGPYLLHCLWS